jgi:hypothetical protein
MEMGLLRVLRVAGGLLVMVAAISAITAGVLRVLFGDGAGKAVGVLLLAVGFWAFVFVLDAAFGRPPQFSDRPWERPWEHEEPHA